MIMFAATHLRPRIDTGKDAAQLFYGALQDQRSFSFGQGVLIRL
jgi:hypothetical protein